MDYTLIFHLILGISIVGLWIWASFQARKVDQFEVEEGLSPNVIQIMNARKDTEKT